jgi:hypothetical protein
MTKQYKEGIYFGMSAEEYFSIPYFSRSFSEDILFDLEEAKHKLENPIKATKAMDLGTAIHSIILEPENFAKNYITRPNQNDLEFEGKKILYTVDDLKPYLEAYGLKKTGKKEDLVASLKTYLDPEDFIIWDEVITNFNNKIEKSGKKILETCDIEIINGIKKQLDKNKIIRAIFENGYAEVTLIWKDKNTGIFCKCRLDFLRADAIGEVKSFSVKNKKVPLQKLIHREIENNRYNLQFTIYLDALEYLIERINAGKAEVFGEVEEEWLQYLLSSVEKRSFILFARTQAPFQIKVKEIERKCGGVGSINQYFASGNELWSQALEKYAEALKTGIWHEQNITILEDAEVPNTMYQII